MLYLASQILVFVAAALVVGVLLAWVFLIGPLRRQREEARRALAATGTGPEQVSPSGVHTTDRDEPAHGAVSRTGQSDAGRVDADGAVEVAPVRNPAVDPATLIEDLNVRLRRQGDGCALDKAELAARLATAEERAARSERRVAATEQRMIEAERQVAAAGERVHQVEQALAEARAEARRQAGGQTAMPLAVVPAARPALGANGSHGNSARGNSDAAGRAGGVALVPDGALPAGGMPVSDEEDTGPTDDAVQALAAEAEQLRVRLAEAEGRAAKFSSRLAMARTEAEEAQRQVATMTTRLDRHQAEWAAERVRLLAQIGQTGQPVPAPGRVDVGHGETGIETDFADDFEFDGRDPALADAVPMRTARRVPGEEPAERPAVLPGPAVPAARTPESGGSGVFPPAGPVEEPGGRRDNLKEIVGIGPVVEARLHALGIASFRQLAELDDDGVDRLVTVLDGFGDRVVSDDWVGQARSLFERHYSATP